MKLCKFAAHIKKTLAANESFTDSLSGFSMILNMHS